MTVLVLLVVIGSAAALFIGLRREIRAAERLDPPVAAPAADGAHALRITAYYPIDPRPRYGFGKPLPADSEVQFAHGRIASVDLRSHPLPYESCTIGLILVHGTAIDGQAAGTCSLPLDASGYVKLPATALTAR